MEADPFIVEATRLAAQADVRLLLVGGVIRDLGLGLEPRDTDFILAGARPARRAEFLHRLATRFGARLVTFRKRGIVNHRLAVRGREADIVEVPGEGISREIARRDFALNSIAFDLRARRVVDLRGGLADLSRRRLRANGRRTFRDDPLRMIRAVRLACDLPGLSIARSTIALIRRDAPRVTAVSAERIREEMDRILAGPRASLGIARLQSLGLLGPILPETIPLRRLRQNRYHHLDAMAHTIAALRAADDPIRLARRCRLAVRPSAPRAPGSPATGRPLIPPGGEPLLLLRWSLLLHDLGKAGTRTLGADGEYHFFGHEKLSAALAAGIMKRLRFPTRRARAVRRLVELHLRIAVPSSGELSAKALRRLVRDAAELVPLLVLHTLADKEASRGPGWKAALARLRGTCRRLVEVHASAGEELLSPARLVGGRDVMERLGIGPGPEVGRILDQIRDRQTAGEISTREEALDLLGRLAAGPGSPPSPR